MKDIKLREIIILIIAVVAVSSALWGWYNPKTVEKTVYRDATEKKENTVPLKIKSKIQAQLSTKQTVTCPEYLDCATQYQCPVCEECTVQALNEKINGLQVTAKAKCPKSNTGYDVASVMNPDNGETSIFIKPEPLPFFSFENDKEIGIRYGLRPEVDLFGRWTFVRVGNLYGAFYGEIGERNYLSNSVNLNAMIEVTYRW